MGCIFKKAWESFGWCRKETKQLCCIFTRDNWKRGCFKMSKCWSGLNTRESFLCQALTLFLCQTQTLFNAKPRPCSYAKPWPCLMPNSGVLKYTVLSEANEFLDFLITQLCWKLKKWSLEKFLSGYKNETK